MKTEPFLVARSQPRARSDIDNGTVYNEWRCRELTEKEVFSATYYREDIYKHGRWILERRSVWTRNNVIEKENEWEVMGFGADKVAALQTGWESSYEQAESLDLLHAKIVMFWREQNSRKTKAFNLVSKLEGELTSLKEEARNEYIKALKAARLYSKAMENKAPPEKIEIIQKVVRNWYNEKKETLRKELEAAKKELDAATSMGFNEDI